MEPQEKTNGALMGSIIIIIILIIGGIYFFKTNLNQAPATPESGVSTESTSTTDLEANVNSIDLENLDNGL